MHFAEEKYKSKMENPMFTLYCMAFHTFSLSYTVKCEQIFFAVMVSMILKIFNVKHVLDKSKR